jgi:SAM-dependent methyltransferase
MQPRLPSRGRPPGDGRPEPIWHAVDMESKRRTAERMRRYWDEGARRNAAWYVDTSLEYDHPDMERFFATGAQIVGIALDDAPIEPIAHGLAVEIGSGLGRLCLALADRYDRVVGIDVSTEMVRRARELVTDERVTFEVGDGISLHPVDTASADLVLSFTVFQHIPSLEVIESYIAEAARILKPGGVFSFQWNNEAGAWRWRVRRVVLSALQQTGIRRERYGRHAPEFLGVRVPESWIRSTLERYGLSLRATRDGGTLFAWAWSVRT